MFLFPNQNVCFSFGCVCVPTPQFARSCLIGSPTAHRPDHKPQLSETHHLTELRICPRALINWNHTRHPICRRQEIRLFHDQRYVQNTVLLRIMVGYFVPVNIVIVFLLLTSALTRCRTLHEKCQKIPRQTLVRLCCRLRCQWKLTVCVFTCWLLFG